MISIVMTYYNRRAQLLLTLQSIEKSVYKDIEVIIVDDCSTELINDVPDLFPFTIKLIRVELKDKWYVNPCIPFNMGIAQVEGDVVIIQNSECFHIHDVLTYIKDNVTDKNYLTVSTYALGKGGNEALKKYENPVELLSKLPNQRFSRVGWYNHPIHQPTYYHFCAGLSKNNLDKLGGFDERYAMGIAYDDDELVKRVRRMALEMIIPTEVSVFHQWHSKINHYSYKEYKILHKRNRVLFNILTKNEVSIWKENRYAR